MTRRAVFDASAVFPGYVPTEVSSEARRCLTHYEAVVVDFMLFETANAASTYARANQLDPTVAQQIQTTIEAAFVVEPAAGHLTQAMLWAIERSHSVYDCLYIAFAVDRGLPLVTADKKLARKFADVLGSRIVSLYDMPDELP